MTLYDKRGTEVFLIVLLFMFLLTALTIFEFIPQHSHKELIAPSVSAEPIAPVQ